ncbi:MAG: rRNA maturation RNase YbeY [Candidatus Omnitrophica bacterium CG11_big_fil_rev_8_21_14_0_20_63_9]|nr:MAG: rRNA maturation RNase YbeY [Candidatus Omnitrophica bacterium CG11_big_fil_rev_8_21_14_0_20_63_9]
MSRATTVRLNVVNAQRRLPVPVRALARFAQRSARRLGIRVGGTIAITFIDAARMRQLNRRFLRHDRPTDVLSFRYEEGEPLVGEILIAPAAARAYAAEHGLAYREELARYVAHGLLHWLGHDDRTRAQQQRMRRLENDLLSARAGQ